MIERKLFNSRVTVIFMGILFIFVQACQQFDQNSAQDKMDGKVDSLLNEMTLQEKVGQMTLFTSDLTTTGPTMRDDYKKLIKQGKVGAIFNAYGSEYTRQLQKMAVENSRLGIPLLFGYDVVHGFRTIFPIPLGEAASWDPELAKQTARVAAREATATGLHWTFAPMVDVARDPRWGRIAEGAGEDTFLNSRFASARVKGFQGDSLDDLQTLIACAKHFVAYGAAEGGRDYNTVNMSDRNLWEIYLPPFQAALDAGVGTFMTSFNEYNGVPATGNQYLFNTILRDKWDFEGFVVTDYTSIPEMIAHGFASNDKQAAHKAIEANVDMDMQSGLYLSELPKLVKEGVVDEDQIDQAVRRVLEMKYRLGLFEDPYRYVDAEREKEELLSEENRKVAREMARESIVLLKNEDSVLPLAKDIKDLAVIGPLADNKQELLGSWSAAGQWEDNVTVLQGIKEKIGNNTRIHYAKGTEISGASENGFDEAIRAAQQSEVAIVALGEEEEMSGEAASRATLDLPGNQKRLLKAIHETETPVVFVLMSGRPLTITWADENISAILETWFLGTETGHAVADILFGDDNPSGKLPVTFPRRVGQVPYYYDHKNTGRPITDKKYTSKYIDVENKPLYPFGYGLSYSTFEYSELELDKSKFSGSDSLQVSVEVSNTGDYQGEEVVQLYIRDMTASVTRPIKELKDFKKISLKPGKSSEVTFYLNREDLSFYDMNLNWIAEPGNFKVFVGTNSRNVKQADFEYLD